MCKGEVIKWGRYTEPALGTFIIFDALIIIKFARAGRDFAKIYVIIFTRACFHVIKL